LTACLHNAHSENRARQFVRESAHLLDTMEQRLPINL
jgi:hypothetical protein